MMAKKKKDGRPSPLAELRAQLEALKQEKSLADVRLRADLAGDTAEELFGKTRRQLRRLATQARRYSQRSDRWRIRLTDLLHDICTGPVVLPRVAGKAPADHDALASAFRKLKTHDFPDLAQSLRAAAGTGELPAYQKFLAEEVLVKGASIVTEHLIRRAAAPRADDDEGDFLGRLGDHVSGNVRQALARQVGYKVTPEVGKLLEERILAVLRLLDGLLTADPPGRLIAPRPDDAFDPGRHEASPGRPSAGELTVSATLFPGYLVLGEAPRIVEKALVYTDRAARAEAEA